MSRVRIEIDEILLDKALRLTGAASEREVVDLALRRLVERGTLYRALRRLRGRLEWDGGLGTSRAARGRSRA